MLDQVTPTIRILIAECRRLAFSGKSDDAQQKLRAAVVNKDGLQAIDRAAAFLAIAELLYIDGDCEASHEIFVSDLDSIIPELPNDTALAIAFNRCDVASGLFDSDGIMRFYDLLDEQRIAGVEHWDDSAMLRAAEHAKKGRNYESVPAVWRELLRTYRQCRWSAFRHASRRMGEECLRIGQPHFAAYHAAISHDAEPPPLTPVPPLPRARQGVKCK